MWSCDQSLVLLLIYFKLAKLKVFYKNSYIIKEAAFSKGLSPKLALTMKRIWANQLTSNFSEIIRNHRFPDDFRG